MGKSGFEHIAFVFSLQKGFPYFPASSFSSFLVYLFTNGRPHPIEVPDGIFLWSRGFFEL